MRKGACTGSQKSYRACPLMLLEAHMGLLWCSSIRKPAVWLATFLSLGATSVASAQDPASAQHKRPPDANRLVLMGEIEMNG